MAGNEGEGGGWGQRHGWEQEIARHQAEMADEA